MKLEEVLGISPFLFSLIYLIGTTQIYPKNLHMYQKSTSSHKSNCQFTHQMLQLIKKFSF